MASQWADVPPYPPDSVGGNNGPDPWIAIGPMARTTDGTHPSADPPTFRESQFDIILRRQRMRPVEGGGLKDTLATASRFLNLSNDFEFAGWGKFLKLSLTSEDRTVGEERIQCIRRAKLLGQFTGAALPGIAVLGGVFYTLPAVVAVSGVYSPISLFMATLALFLWRPIMEELASVLPMSGAPYSYILNIARKSLALLSATLLLLDFASTSVVSASTATSYLAGEVVLPFPTFVGAVLVLVIFALVSLTGLKESTRIAFVVMALHVGTMVALTIAASVHWARTGNAQLQRNWAEGQPPTRTAIAHQLFNGFCLGMLGLTGVECTPSYIGAIKPGRFPLVLRNVHLPAIVLNTIMITLVLATVPLEQVISGANVLSVLAGMSAGPWLRRWIVVDATVVLCGGVLTGILSACELFEQLARDRVVPQMLLRVLPFSGAPYISVLVFTAISAILYASAGASLSVLSKMFTLVWLTVMGLFPLALLLLRFNRGRMPGTRTTPLSLAFFVLALTAVVFAGNIAIDPSTAGTRLMRAVYWIYDQYPVLHRCSGSKMWGKALVDAMARLKRQPVCILVKTDAINLLLHMLLYVRENEETSCVKIVHFYDEENDVPSELEANAKILDEAFPEITIDLIIVHGMFSPANVASLAHRLQIPSSLMFMSCPGPEFAYPIAEFGARIISL
ncbi:Aaap amino acid permease [Mycena sanguinolenta]|uniref:Aaap amino acid permease n=1 Tax=Mycena sanguinolenta TaxID=230812 RepID=A0A8H6ZGY8_9AGAR|nr:Aaap amino acid permease [Mycena sanguinolenta]